MWFGGCHVTLSELRVAYIIVHVAQQTHLKGKRGCMMKSVWEANLIFIGLMMTHPRLRMTHDHLPNFHHNPNPPQVYNTQEKV